MSQLSDLLRKHNTSFIHGITDSDDKRKAQLLLKKT